MEEKLVIRALTALAQELRLRVFRALVVAGDNGATPTELAQSFGVPAATLSFHLKELMNAGLVAQERQGRRLIYRAEFDAMGQLLSFLTENCCEGRGCTVAELSSNFC